MNSRTASKLCENSIRLATTICTSVAKAGAPLFVRCAKGRKAGRSSPITIVTRGPIHIIALTVETRPIEINASTRRPPLAPKM